MSRREVARNLRVNVGIIKGRIHSAGGLITPQAEQDIAPCHEDRDRYRYGSPSSTTKAACCG